MTNDGSVADKSRPFRGNNPGFVVVPLLFQKRLFFIMTDMYEDPVSFDGKLKPYPHAERPAVRTHEKSKSNPSLRRLSARPKHHP